MRVVDPDGNWPDLSDTALASTAAEWLAPHLHGMTRLAELTRLDVHRLLHDLLDGERAERLDRELPAQITLPGGRATVDYTQSVPLAAARAQAFYGLCATPLLAGGKVKLSLALLSPAGRPIAVTGDIAAFWRGGWSDARRDMRGRYPKHAWPENPVDAPFRP